MSKKVLIIGTSPRKNGNSNRLAQEFEKGAREAGNDVDVVYLYDKNINFCKGCLACQKLNHCVIDDDANSITEKSIMQKLSYGQRRYIIMKCAVR